MLPEDYLVYVSFFPLVVNRSLQASLEQTQGKERRMGRLGRVSMLKPTQNKTHETQASSVN